MGVHGGVFSIEYCVGGWRARSGGEREREIFIFPWLQVRVTGPRHHLASSLRIRAQGTRLEGYIYRGFQVWSLRYAARFGMEWYFTLYMFVLAVVAYLLDEPGRRWAWYDSGCLWLVVWLLVCFAEDVVSQRMLFRRGSSLWDRLGFLFLESLAHPDEFG